MFNCVFCQGNEQGLQVVQKLCTWFLPWLAVTKTAEQQAAQQQQQQQQNAAAGLEACDPWPGTGEQQQQQQRGAAIDVLLVGRSSSHFR
jgi:hypothetical protein